MNSLLRLYNVLPVLLRIVIAWAVLCTPLLLVRGALPPGMAWALIGSITAFFGIYYLFHKALAVVDRHRGDRLDHEIAQQTGGPSRMELAEREREFKQKWRDGIDKLQQSKISLYQLPWYIILGEPGGGKTMTLLNSGMDFPLGKDELPGFGGTRNYNWWFTNTSVILDTAGRLVFEQEGTSDRHEWEAFLALLKRRRRCPINGVIVALPADKLMSDTAEQRHASAGLIRDRLRQIQNGLEVRFPVFLLITKSDLVAGFTEFYNHLSSLQRNQLFGWSRPGPFEVPYEPREFNCDYDRLFGRLHQLRLQFLGRQTTGPEAGWIYTFPDTFAALKDRVQNYIDVIFSRNIFAEPLFFRGFYFTSALQEGKPILEILGRHLSGEELDNLEGIFPQSRAFFIHDFYAEKVAREQGMVFRSQRHIRRMRLLRNSALFVGLPLILILAAVTVWGYQSYAAAVAGPRRTVDQAVAFIEQHRPAAASGTGPAEPPLADVSAAVALARDLTAAMERIHPPGGPAALMFGSAGSQAQGYIRSVQRELIGTGILRPEVVRVEQALTADHHPMTAASVQEFAASLAAYVSWHLGEVPTSMNDVEALRRVLPGSDYSVVGQAEQIGRLFQRHGDLPAVRVTAALSGSRQDQRQRIQEALGKAQSFWLQTAALESDADVAWWAELVRRCQEMQESYTTLVRSYRDFENARTRETFERTAQRWLETFPRPAGAAPAQSRQLLQRIREHGVHAPTDNGRIVRLQQLGDAALAGNKAFWETVSAALSAATSDEDQAFAGRLRDQVRSYQEAFATQLELCKSRLLPQVSAIERDVLQWSAGPAQRYEFVRPLEDAERVLAELAGQLTGQTATAQAFLAGWSAQLQELIDQRSAELALDVGRQWQQQDLERLVRAIAESQRRYRLDALVEDIAERLGRLDDVGLAYAMEDQDEYAKALQFPGLKNRHAAPFILNTIRAKQRLSAVLNEAVERSLLIDISGLDSALNRAQRQYLQHYLQSWSHAYDRHRLDGLSPNDLPSDWDGYRRWMRDHGTTLQDQYDADVEALRVHVIELLHPGREQGAAQQQDLLADLPLVDWPADSRLHRVVAQTLAAPGMLDFRPVSIAWKQFRNQVQEFRLDGLDDLQPGAIEFPVLAAVGAGQAALQEERMTRQLQFVIDLGRHLLWRDLFEQLQRRHLREFEARPFVFRDGQFDAVDPPRLRALLQTLAGLQQFNGQPADPATRTRGAWLQNAARWHQFLDRESYQVELSYEVEGPENQTPAEFYRTVALRLPGVTKEGGDGGSALIAFGAERSSAPQRFRWQPRQGQVEVLLQNMTDKARRLRPEIEPRLATLPGGEFGLIRLIREYGEAAPGQDGTWMIRIRKDLSELDGLSSEPPHPPIRSVAFKLRFLDPAGGLPPFLDWPDPAVWVGTPPQLPQD